MFTRNAALVILALATPGSAFVANQAFTRPATTLAAYDKLSVDALRAQLNYKPGEADTDFAKKFKHLVGAKVKTVGEAFAEFTDELGYSVNPLYKGMITDLVGTTHLTVVSARFQRDPVWSLGIVTALELLFKNYPEPDVAEKIISALFKSVGLDEAEVMAEAKQMSDWAASATREEVETALNGEGSTQLATVANAIKGEQFWMYSRYFGIGLLKMMETLGIEMDKDEVYPIMEEWMSVKLGRSHLTACADSDLFFKVREKLDMMETMMKEIEIREKKRLAERLEEKAESALRAAEREVGFQAEIDAEAAADKAREKIESA